MTAPTSGGALGGRAAIITGANQGLGLEIARAYVEAGASVVLCARDTAKLEQARKDVAARCTGDQIVAAVAADVSDGGAVERLVATAIERCGRIHVLVSNAGVYGPMGPSESVDWAAWTRAIEINLYGSVLPCRALLPHLKTHGYGKIVQLSGGGATGPLPNISAYAASKAAIVRFVETIALEVRPYHIDVNAIAPGALKTRMLDEVLEAGPERVGADFHQRMVRTKEHGGTPLAKGAALAVYLGSAASDGITGRLLSAVWDPWERLAEHRADLENSDIYTLRRIVPGDRGRTWGGK
jgi:NAD(P)-dependent dehydrogenase (short-subunit alcohol dehydrogenase family)